MVLPTPTGLGARLLATLALVPFAVSLTACSSSDDDWQRTSTEALAELTKGSSWVERWSNQDTSYGSDPDKSIDGTALVPTPLNDLRDGLDTKLTNLGWDEPRCKDADAAWAGRNLPDDARFSLSADAAICALFREGDPYGHLKLVSADDSTWMTFGLGPEAGSNIQFEAP